MSAIPENPDALLNRADTAAALTDAGYPVAKGTLATKATRGGGPPYRLFGRIPLYRWGDALAWAQSRLSDPVRNTSEGDFLASRSSAKTDKREGGKPTKKLSFAGGNARGVARRAADCPKRVNEFYSNDISVDGNERAARRKPA